MAKGLSDDQMRCLLPGVNVVLYPELADYQTIDDVFKGRSCAVLLVFTIGDTDGHWMALLKNPGGRRGRIEVFDSYGEPPDGELPYVSAALRRRTNQESPLLLPLLINSGYEVEYSDVPIQRLANRIVSCGPHVVVRCLNDNLDNDEQSRIYHHDDCDADEFDHDGRADHYHDRSEMPVCTVQR